MNKTDKNRFGQDRMLLCILALYPLMLASCHIFRIGDSPDLPRLCDPCSGLYCKPIELCIGMEGLPVGWQNLLSGEGRCENCTFQGGIDTAKLLLRPVHLTIDRSALFSRVSEVLVEIIGAGYENIWIKCNVEGRLIMSSIPVFGNIGYVHPEIAPDMIFHQGKASRIPSQTSALIAIRMLDDSTFSVLHCEGVSTLDFFHPWPWPRISSRWLWAPAEEVDIAEDIIFENANVDEGSSSERANNSSSQGYSREALTIHEWIEVREFLTEKIQRYRDVVVHVSFQGKSVTAEGFLRMISLLNNTPLLFYVLDLVPEDQRCF